MLEFGSNWLVVASVLLILAAIALAWWKRAAAPSLFAAAAAAFMLAGARPSVGGESGEVTHAFVQDVSHSMASRRGETDPVLASIRDAVELPDGHSLRRYELSDALRGTGGPEGAASDFSRLTDLSADDAMNGEVILVTDGRGDLAGLLAAVSPGRLVLLRAPAPSAADASVVSFQGPTAVADGGTAILRGEIFCDQVAVVRWRMLRGTEVIAQGRREARAGATFGVSHNYVAEREGLTRVRLVVETDGDREPRNDEASLAFYAGTRRVILYCVPRGFPRDGDALLAALEADTRHEIRLRNELPATPRALDGVGLLVINNLPLHESGMSREGLDVIGDWVMSGGNLLMAGAEGAFGPGGYRGTAIEAMMPVRFRPEDVPPRRTLLLLDVSASMDEPLPGGSTRLQRLREAATRLLDASDVADAVALAGFNQSIRNEVVFRRPDDPAQQALLQALRADLGTRIHAAMQDGVSALGEGGDENRRLIVVTDGEDTGGTTREQWLALGARMAEARARVDLVLTQPSVPEWAGWLQETAADVHVSAVGERGFNDLLETLDRALAGGDSEWVSRERWEVPGVMSPLRLLAKTALRDDASVEPMLDAIPPGQPRPMYPLLSRRQLVGRSAALTTRTWGEEAEAQIWGDEAFTEWLSRAINFVTETANRQNLLLNVLAEGAELVWVGTADAPQRDLHVGDSGLARLTAPGRWLLDSVPTGDELAVFDGEVLLQRLPLPAPVPLELQRTGDDEAFFAQAEQAGVRVVHSLAAWQPRRIDAPSRQPVDLTWLPALVALVLLGFGFALRRR